MPMLNHLVEYICVYASCLGCTFKWYMYVYLANEDLITSLFCNVKWEARIVTAVGPNCALT